MAIVLSVINFALFLLILALVVTLVVSWIQVFSRDWRPRGIVILLVEPAYTITDPIIKAVRRVVPTINLGGMQLDLAYMIVFFVVFTAWRLT